MEHEALNTTMPRRAADRAPVHMHESVLAAITQRIALALDPERIYLFGSRARGDARLDSDYDVLVLVRANVDRSQRLAPAGYRALRGIDAAVDLVVMSTTYFERRRVVVASLPATVAREGKLLYAA